eukprot:403349308
MDHFPKDTQKDRVNDNIQQSREDHQMAYTGQTNNSRLPTDQIHNIIPFYDFHNNSNHSNKKAIVPNEQMMLVSQLDCQEIEDEERSDTQYYIEAFERLKQYPKVLNYVESIVNGQNQQYEQLMCKQLNDLKITQTAQGKQKKKVQVKKTFTINDFVHLTLQHNKNQSDMIKQPTNSAIDPYSSRFISPDQYPSSIVHTSQNKSNKCQGIQQSCLTSTNDEGKVICQEISNTENPKHNFKTKIKKFQKKTMNKQIQKQDEEMKLDYNKENYNKLFSQEERDEIKEIVQTKCVRQGVMTRKQIDNVTQETAREISNGRVGFEITEEIDLKRDTNALKMYKKTKFILRNDITDDFEQDSEEQGLN